MIDVKELRIGNWVMSKSNKPGDEFEMFEVTRETHAGISRAYGSMPYEIFPIPLTHELLERCGFKRNDYTKHKDNPHVPQAIRDRDFFDYRKETLMLELTFNNWRCFYTTDSDTSALIGNIESLHQLQNLFFALTSTELVVK